MQRCRVLPDKMATKSIAYFINIDLNVKENWQKTRYISMWHVRRQRKSVGLSLEVQKYGCIR